MESWVLGCIRAHDCVTKFVPRYIICWTGACSAKMRSLVVTSVNIKNYIILLFIKTFIKIKFLELHPFPSGTQDPPPCK